MTILEQSTTSLAIPGVSAIGWNPTHDLTLEEWLSLAEPIRRTDQQVTALYWAIGDWLVWGEQRFGEAWSQAEAVLGRTLSMGTLQNIMYVARHVPPELRRADVPFWHHREIIPLARGDLASRLLARTTQKELLEKAATEEFTCAELAREVRQERKRRRWEEISPRTGDLPVVVWADPPWAAHGDDGLGLNDLKKRPPPATPDSLLLLWSEPERLAASVILLSAWGYTLKDVAVADWGHAESGWVRSRHQFMLLAAKGQVPDPGEPLSSPVSTIEELETWVTRWWPGLQETAEW